MTLFCIKPFYKCIGVPLFRIIPKFWVDFVCVLKTTSLYRHVMYIFRISTLTKCRVMPLITPNTQPQCATITLFQHASLSAPGSNVVQNFVRLSTKAPLKFRSKSIEGFFWQCLGDTNNKSPQHVVAFRQWETHQIPSWLFPKLPPTLQYAWAHSRAFSPKKLCFSINTM